MCVSFAFLEQIMKETKVSNTLVGWLCMCVCRWKSLSERQAINKSPNQLGNHALSFEKTVWFDMSHCVCTNNRVLKPLKSVYISKTYLLTVLEYCSRSNHFIGWGVLHSVYVIHIRCIIHTVYICKISSVNVICKFLFESLLIIAQI